MPICKALCDNGTDCQSMSLEGKDFCLLHIRNVFNESNLLDKPYRNIDTINCLGNNRKCSFKAISGTLCQFCWFNLYRKINKNYPYMSEIVKTFEYLMNDEKLFITKYTHMIEEWDFNKNIRYDIRIVTYGSTKKVHWKCRENHEWEQKVTTRTRGGLGTKCKECFTDSNRVIDKTELHDKRIAYFENENKAAPVKIGDESEQHITDMLIETNMFKTVEKLGHLAGDSDICITHFDESINYIQVKTMTKRKYEDDVYTIINTADKREDKYPDNMLIVGINNERNRFMSVFWKDIKKNPNLSLYFNSEKSIYKHLLFKSKEEFIKRLLDQIPNSTNVIRFDENNIKELQSLKNLEAFCLKNGLSYKRNNTNSDAVDCFINGHRIQSKFATFNEKTSSVMYAVGAKKSSGKINGKLVFRCYEEKDFDFVVMEVGGTRLKKDGNLIMEPDKYKNNFCIVPMDVLKLHGHITTNGSDGKQNIRLCPPNYSGKHWTKEFWNRIDLLTSK